MDAYRSSKMLSASRDPERMENEQYSIGIVQDLMQGTSEWINIQDIVKLTFKAMLDVVKRQDAKISDFEKLLPTKASKAEMNSGLSQKANVADISRTISEVATTIDSKVSMEDIQTLLEDKISRKDFAYALNEKVGFDEIRNSMDKSVSIEEYKAGMRDLVEQIDTIRKETTAKLTKAASMSDVEELKSVLNEKANLSEINEGMQKKASKESVANALKRKANIVDVNAAFAKKIDVEDMHKILEAVDQKTDYQDFDALRHSLTSAIEQADRIAKDMELKASKEEIEAILNDKNNESKKIEENNMREYLTQLNAVSQHLDEELDVVKKSMSSKAENRHIGEIREMLNKKADIEKTGNELVDIRMGLKEHMSQTLSKIDSAYKRVEEVKIRLERDEQEIVIMQNQALEFTEDLKRTQAKHDDNKGTIVAQLKQEVKEDQARTKDLLQELRTGVEDLKVKKCDRSELTGITQLLQQDVDQKVSVSNAAKSIAEASAKTAGQLNEMYEEIKSLKQTTQYQLETKANLSDIDALMRAKSDEKDLLLIIQQKASVGEVNELRAGLDSLSLKVDKKADIAVLKESELKIKEQHDEIEKDLALKSNIKDVCTLIDVKANTDEVSHLAAELKKEIETKASMEELSHALSDQSQINEALCAENCTGRWQWKSGALKNGYAVPWEIQTINNFPENYLWEKDAVSVLTVTEGLYEIALGFFSHKKPIIKVLINGEVALSTLNTST